MPGDSRDLGSLSMTELFRIEVENQSAMATEALLELEKDPSAIQWLDVVMRAAHSLKGASRIGGRNAGVQVSHAMEDRVVSAQREAVALAPNHVDALLRGFDLMGRVAQLSDNEVEPWEAGHKQEIESFIASLNVAGPGPAVPVSAEAPASSASPQRGPESDRTVRVRAANLNRLLGLAGEGLVRSRWLQRFSGELLDLKRTQERLSGIVERLRDDMIEKPSEPPNAGRVADLREADHETRDAILRRLEDFQRFEREASAVSSRLYQEVLESRMRPFGDRADAMPRMVRDLARSIGKEATLEVVGESTPVDRDILEKLEAPLGHLLRNAIDHGLETPEGRRAAGKTPSGTLRIEARHSSGMLGITIADDGRGIDVDAVRRAVIDRGMVTAATAASLADHELFEFLFLPAFSLKESVTEISGRGVGLDVVKTMVKEVGGSVRVRSEAGRGTEFLLQLPLTLSVVRALVVEIGGEPYAFPLARVESALRVDAASVASVQGRQHIAFRDRQIGLVAAHQALELQPAAQPDQDLSVIVIGEGERIFGVVVDRFVGENELVVRTIDPHLGKIQDISAAAMMDDGTPALIIDVDDLIRTIENLVTGGRLVDAGETSQPRAARKRVLVVDDSLTVREVERKLLERSGYDVEVAVDGMDGWNAARTGRYDLIVTDVDMPRLDGIELVTRLKADSRLSSIPVMIVSYKDREEDRRRGLEAGADYYLTKGSFQDESLIRAVADLIGEAGS